MKPVIVHLKLPDDLSNKVRELAGNRRLATVIIEALRAQWFPEIPECPECHYVQQEGFAVGHAAWCSKRQDGVKGDIFSTYGSPIAPIPEAEKSVPIWPTYGSIPAEQRR